MIRSRLHSCSENIVKKHQGKKKVSFASVGRKISAAFIFGNFWTMKTLSPASISKSTHSNTKWKLKTQTFLQAGSSETQNIKKNGCKVSVVLKDAVPLAGGREGGGGGCCICVCVMGQTKFMVFNFQARLLAIALVTRQNTTLSYRGVISIKQMCACVCALTHTQTHTLGVISTKFTVISVMRSSKTLR